jgi:hypothetical protein
MEKTEKEKEKMTFGELLVGVEDGEFSFATDLSV